MKNLSTTAILLLLSLTQHVYVSSFHTPQPHMVRQSAAADGESTQQHSRGLIYPGLLPTATTHSHSSCSSSTALFGIPKMFRWLTDQYPNILNRRLGSAQSIPPIDNFYLDMNGIIHPCTYGNNEVEIVSHSLYCSCVLSLRSNTHNIIRSRLSLMKLKCSKRSLDMSIDCTKL